MKKIFSTIVIGSILATGTLYAKDCDFKDGKKSYQKAQMSKNHSHKMMHKNNGFRSMMRALASLDLSDKQWVEVKKAVLDMQLQNLDAYSNKQFIDYFDDESFNTTSYIDERSKSEMAKLKTQAQTIEKITKLLNEDQFEAFKENLKQPPQRFQFDKKRSKRSCDK